MQLFFKQIKKLLSKSKKKLIKKVTFPFLYWQYDILIDYLAQITDIYFIQIGSNDGIVDDLLFEKIHKFDYKGILIEPVPYLFKKLKDNYKNKAENLIFENIAIGNKRDTLPFYRLDEKNSNGISMWYEGLGSFKKEVLIKHKNAIKNFGWLNDEVECGGLVRCALFLGKMKVPLNQQGDAIDESDATKYMLMHNDENSADYKKIKMMLRVSDRDGAWTKNYDSVFLGKFDLDDGTVFNDYPLWVIKEWSQQIVLSSHIIDKTTLDKSWSRDSNYFIL
jgi:FkbM family methyltransferase